LSSTSRPLPPPDAPDDDDSSQSSQSPPPLAPLPPRTDAGNAKLFAALNRGKVLYDHLRHRWLIWTGIRWREDSDEHIKRLALLVPRRRRYLAEQISDLDRRKQEYSYSFSSENANKIEAMLKLARAERGLADDGKNWDADPWLLGCDNGAVDLRTGRITCPQPLLRISKTTHVNYDPFASCPKWLATLKAMWPQPEIVNYVQRIFGYAITGSTKEQALFCFYGEGQNGKSTMLGAVRHALGDYAYTMPFSTIEFANRSSVSNDVASLYGKRMVISSETQEDVQLNEGRIKSLTGESTVTARFLHQEYFTFTPVSKFFLAFNHKPRIRDDSHGFFRRLKLIEIAGMFSGAREIKGFESQLAEEAPGILNWLIAGCLQWQQQGINTPSIITDATEGYRLESNPLQLFIEERCEQGSNLLIPGYELWAAYQHWLHASGERYGLSRTSFGRRLKSMGFDQKVAKLDQVATRIWIGLQLQSDNKSEPDISIVEDDDDLIN
jgi:putative DNA primase/helicase